MGVQGTQMSLWVLVALLAATPVGAQSLAEVARKEAARRAATPSAGKVYSNEDLTPDFSKPADEIPAAPAGTASPSAPPAEAGEATAGAAEAAGAPATAAGQEGVTPLEEQEPQRKNDKGEDYWRGRAERIRSRLNAQNAELSALRQRLASFAPGAAGPEREIAANALDKAVADLKDLNDEWLRFERQARDRGIPDAWIR